MGTRSGLGLIYNQSMANQTVGRIIPAQPTLAGLPPTVQREFEQLRAELTRLNQLVSAQANTITSLEARISALESTP